MSSSTGNSRAAGVIDRVARVNLGRTCDWQLMTSQHQRTVMEPTAVHQDAEKLLLTSDGKRKAKLPLTVNAQSTGHEVNRVVNKVDVRTQEITIFLGQNNPNGQHVDSRNDREETDSTADTLSVTSDFDFDDDTSIYNLHI